MRAMLALVTALAAVLSLAVGSASALDRPQTFSVLEIDESDQATIINGFEFQRTPVAGDRFAFKSGLYKWAGTKRGARIGYDQGLCTFIRVSTAEGFSADALCAAELFLPAGGILLEGAVHFTEGPGRFEVPIVGGTRAYANARGFARLRDLGGGDSGHTNIELHLLP